MVISSLVAHVTIFSEDIQYSKQKESCFVNPTLLQVHAT